MRAAEENPNSSSLGLSLADPAARNGHSFLSDDELAVLQGIPPHEMGRWVGEISLEKAFSLIHELFENVDELKRRVSALEALQNG